MADQLQGKLRASCRNRLWRQIYCAPSDLGPGVLWLPSVSELDAEPPFAETAKKNQPRMRAACDAMRCGRRDYSINLPGWDTNAQCPLHRYHRHCRNEKRPLQIKVRWHKPTRTYASTPAITTLLTYNTMIRLATVMVALVAGQAASEDILCGQYETHTNCGHT